MLHRLRSMFGLETKATSTFSEFEALLSSRRQTAAGVSVGPEAAMHCSPAFACIRIIGETVEQVPLHLYRKLPDGGRERVTDHPAARLLKAPNEFTTAGEFKLLLGTHLAAYGNAYAWTGRDDAGNPVEAIPLDPRRVSVKPDDLTMAPQYTVTAGNGTQRTYSRADVLHVRGPGLDVYRGTAPVELAREAIGLSLTLESHCGSLFGRGAKPSGVLKVKGKKSPEALARIRALFSQFYGGADAEHRTMLLDEDTDFTQVQLNSVDAQTLEMRRFQVAEISRYWRIPLSLLNDLERVTHANAESLAMQFVQFTMLPVFRSISDALALTLLRPEERDDLFFDWVVDDFVRADLATRMQAYATGISHSILSPDEARQMENRGRIPDGSGATFTRPVNVGVQPPAGAAAVRTEDTADA
ncbi:phage portal protein [Roseomonas genomospecies 6]|uniref:Phage portal protein n=1 Tax=Roseomonas genomospecies 6 TaxID=214106 RepID=A0A9W7NJ74_9PROT|nr:phage portal protein [Roseomonas genomospecies 6]KAA0680288.1 phage portal protein [Roseomonas genomospecies 6]